MWQIKGVGINGILPLLWSTGIVRDFDDDENKALEENNILVSIWGSFVLRGPALGLIPFNISIPGGTEVWQMLKSDNLLTFSPGDIPYLCC